MVKKLYEEAVRLLEQKKSFAMATVITSDGSTPRGPGAKMIIRPDGTITGTVGGGSLEAAVMRAASGVIKDKKARVEEFHLNTKDLSQLGMICGGDLDVLIDYVDSSDPEYLNIYKTMLDLHKKRKASYLVTLVPSEENEFSTRKQFIMLEDGSVPGNFSFNTAHFKSYISKGVSYKIVNYNNKKKAILEVINTPHMVYIFGAGHVGEKLAWLLNFVDFPVTVLDDRPEFANIDRFPHAEIHVIKNFENAFDGLVINRHSFIVIVTRGHVHDGTTLGSALQTEAGYIGMIGSKRKREGIYKRLTESGVDAERLKQIHAPIGIPIGDETPEEIAVSITAELIKVRSEME
jgi:xanthine dehydrogenase accessory factor